MAKRGSNPPKSAPNLIVAREEAEQRLRTQIEKGQAILGRSIQNEQQLAEARKELGKWSRYNSELLTRLFDNESIREEYEAFHGVLMVSSGLHAPPNEL
jgi:hypothetical protein